MRREPTYDPEADAAYIPLSDAKPYEAEEVAPGVILDYTEDGLELALTMDEDRPGRTLSKPAHHPI